MTRKQLMSLVTFAVAVVVAAPFVVAAVKLLTALHTLAN